MNKNLFRIIFNKRRGQRMAVAETSASQGKVAAGESRAFSANTTSDYAVVALSALSFAMLCALGVVLWVLPTPYAHAQVVAYRNAPGNQQATILQTANGVPQVNIQTPSAAGVSRNVYSQFDVQSNGVILNNSRTSVQTQQGGWVQGNPWLATGSARVILNEVNSSNPSYLNGYVEVAGQRAEVVIANPSGISVNGGGFINTSKPTLTTGTPIVNGGSLDGYRVQGGNISINGNGLDLSTTDYAAILARAVQVNAGIWANELKVVTGANQVDASSLATNTTPVTTTLAGTGAVPSFALDVAQIGGMYAGKIHLIGTEQGLGVRTAGMIGSTGGDLVLQNNGWLTNTGTLQAGSNLQITTQGKITNSGTLYAGQNTDVTAHGEITNTGLISARGNVDLGALGPQGNIQSNNTAVIAAGMQTSGALVNLGSTENVRIHADQDVQYKGKLLAPNLIDLSAAVVDVQSSQAVASTLAATARTGDLDASSTNLQTTSAVRLSTPTTLHTNNATVGSPQLIIQANDWNNRSGQVAHTGPQAFEVSLNGQFDNTGGLIQADQASNMSIRAAGINNTDGKLLGAQVQVESGALTNIRGSMYAAQQLNLSSSMLTNTQGVISSDGDAQLRTAAIHNDRGLVQAATDLVIDTAGSALTNTRDTSLTLQGIVAGRDLTLNAGDLNNAGGLIAANRDASLKLASLNNEGGLIQASGALSLDVQLGQINNASGLLAGTNLTLKALEIDNTRGKLAGDAGVSIQATRQLTQTEGVVHANTALSLSTGQLNGAGDLLSGGHLAVDIGASYTHDQAARMLAIGNLSLNVQGDLINQGELQAGGNLNLTSSSLNNQATAQIVAAQTSTLNVAGLTNRGLIDAASTQITATGNVTNLGTGRIYGDAIGIQANAVLNDHEIVNGLATAATMAARNRLDIGAQTLTNTNNALIYSDGDLAIGGALDNTRQATGVAQNIVNNGSTIEAAKTLSLNAQDIQNLNRGLTYRVDTIANPTRNKEYVLDGGGIVAEDQTFALYRATSSSVRYHPDHRSTAYLWSPGSSLYVINPQSQYNTLSYRNAYNAADVVTLSGTVVNAAGLDAARWQFYELTAPTSAAPNGTRPDGVCNAYDGEGFCLGYDLTAQRAWDAAAAPYVELQNKIDALRASMNAEGVRVNNWADFTTDIQVLTVTNSNPGKITSGTHMTLNASRNLLNDMSQIVAGGTLGVNGVSLENRQRTEATTDVRTGTNYLWSYKDWGCGNYRGCDWTLTAYWTSPYSATINKTSTLSLAQSLQNQSVNSSYSVAGMTGMNTMPSVSGASSTQLLTGSPNGYVAAPINTQVPNNSLYRQTVNPNASYLVETDPAFTNQKTWLGSDYMLQALTLDPNFTQKRLGDGFYEQKLIREQVASLTGKRFLGDYTSDDQAYKALMDSGLLFAKQYELRPGIALTDAQMAQLTSDIVWLVSQDVTLADGRVTQALVPQVYLKPQAGDLAVDGALISGNNLDIQLSGDLKNLGTLAGRKVVSLAANNLHNLGGNIQAEDLQLLARQDLNNIGGTMRATNSLNASAGKDLNVSSTLQQGGSADGAVSMQNIERVAGLYVSGSNGQLSLYAGHNIDLTAAKVVNAGNGATRLEAGNAVNFKTLTESKRLDVVMEEGKQYARASQSQEVGSTVSAGGNLSVTAQDIHARAATLEAATQPTATQGTLSLSATRNINIEAGQATQNFSGAIKSASHGGVLGSDSETITKRVNNSTTALATNLGGKDVQINAGNDIAIKGSNVVSDQATTLTAQNNVTIEAAHNTQTQGYSQQTVEKGFLSGGGFGISYGERKQSLDNQNTTTTAAASTVGSINGNVTITAGNQYKQVGSDVVTPAGDISIQAKNVTIQEARETNTQNSEQKFEQSGVTLALNSTVVSTVQNAQNQIKATTQTSDSRMKTLGAASAAANVKMAADALKAGQGDEHGMVKTGAEGADGSPEVAQANAADKAGGISVSLSYGTSSSQSNSSATSDTARGSTVKAGGTTTIQATGSGQSSNLTVQGSDISGQQVALAADHEVAFLAASNTRTQTSSNHNSSASVGVAAQLGNAGSAAGADMGFTASVSQGKGSGNGTETTYTNTHIKGTDSVTIQSGGDTTLKGATVEGKQITTNVGGNLNIESLQDTATYAEKNQQAGASVMIGAGTGSGSVNFAKSNINSNYASVKEQSAIKAGDGGFTVNVQGNTDLKGGAITSTQAAIDQNKNTFSTGGTLTTSDIQNKANYNASSAGVSVGVGSTPLPGQGLSSTLTGAGLGKDSGNASSTTTAGISGVAGDTAKRTGDNAQGIGKIFDADKVRQEIQAQTKITQEFAKQASTAVASYTETQRKVLQEQAKQLEKTGTPEEIAQAQQAIKELNMQEKVLNILVGAVTGFGETMVTKESLKVAAEQMREAVAEDSAKFKGVVDSKGNPLFSNQSGDSAGVDGDEKKQAGTRANLDLLCGADNSRCAKNSDGSLALTDKGEVKFIGTKNRDDSYQTYAEFLQTEDGKQMTSAPFGGQQGSARTWLFGEYPKGGIVDKLLETFAGPHDTIGGKSSGLYDDLGNTTRGRSDAVKAAHEVWSGVALIPSAPFAAAQGLPPEVWKAIGILLKGGQ